MSTSSEKNKDQIAISSSQSSSQKNWESDLDIHDSPKDEGKLKSETAIIDLPDVKDIPGQEFIHPAPLGELADNTIASDDEEGVGILDENDEDEPDNDSNVSNQEKKELERADEDMPTKDDENLRRADMDNEDNDGEPLNEEGFGEDVSGGDLDVPGAEADDADEEAGSEDEENNVYSASDENNDNVPNQANTGEPE